MNKVDFGNGKIARNILRTTLPMLAAQLLNLLYSIVDRIYIGRIAGVGTLALGAVGLCFPVVILITGFTNLYGMGGSPLFAMELGRGRPQRALEYQNTSFCLLLATGAVLTVLGEAFCPQLLALFGATSAEMTHALPYLRIYLAGTVFSMVATGMNPFINAQGYATLGMVTVTIGAAANLVLDPIFIFVLGLGVPGAAVATVLAQALSMGFVLWFLLRRQNPCRVRCQLQLCRVREIVGLGMASFIMQFTNALVSVSCNGVLMACGGSAYVSVMTIVNSVRQVVDTPVSAIAEGTSPILSFNYGAGNHRDVRRTIRIMTVLAVGYTLVMWAFIQWVPGWFIGIFSTDAALLQKAVPALHIYFAAFVFQAFQYSGQIVFKALGRKYHAIFFSLLRKVALVVPLIYLFAYGFGWGTSGVFWAEPVSNLLGGTACYGTMLALVYRRLDQKNASRLPAGE